jgi:hypothetical protein
MKESWFDYEMYPTGACIGDLVAGWWAYGKWLDPEGSDICNE